MIYIEIFSGQGGPFYNNFSPLPRYVEPWVEQRAMRYFARFVFALDGRLFAVFPVGCQLIGVQILFGHRFTTKSAG